MKSPLDKIPSFLNRGDDFVTLEIFRDHMRVASLKIDDEKKSLIIQKITDHKIKTLSDVENVIKKIRRLKNKKIILALGPHIATTIYSSVSLVRDNPSALIEESDLDNIVSQATWKFFDRRRQSIANKMKVDDFDLIFTDARVLGIRLDGHKVVNPVGFKARTVKISFSQTFLTRAFSDLIKEFLPVENIVFVGEAGTLISNLLALESSQDRFLTTTISLGHTDVFLVNDQDRNFFDTFPWGFENLKEHVADQLSVSSSTAETIVELYTHGETSSAFARRFEQLLMKEFNNFIKGLSRSFKRSKTDSAFLHTRITFPDFFFASSFSRRFDQRKQIQPVTTDFVGDNFGYEVECKNPEDMPKSFLPLFYFLEWRFTPVHSKLEQLAKRQVRWLSPLKEPIA